MAVATYGVGATEVEWAWLAGLFEGEGSLVFRRTNEVTLNITSTDEDVVCRAHAIAGVGSVNGPYRKPRRKPVWAWVVHHGDEVGHVLDGIEAHLCSRRGERAREARPRLAAMRSKGHCNQGHPMSGDNLAVTPKGARSCRACQRRRQREYLGITPDRYRVA